MQLRVTILCIVEYPQLDLDVQLCFPLYAASRALTRRYGLLLSDAGLTYPQYLTMLALWGGAPMSVGALGERLSLDSGTLTPLLKRLEADGIVRRTRDAQDERRVIVEPTADGWALREKVAHVPIELAAILGLTASDVRHLRRILGKLAENVEGIPSQSPQ